jgi:RNA polymerase sigma-70 factor (ECF subfamily)
VLNRAADLATRARPAPVDIETLDEAELFGFEVDDPVALLERAADDAAMRAALSKLNPVDRMVLVLHDGEGWGAKEIAEACGLAPAAAHKRIQRGRFRLANALNEPAGDPKPNEGHCVQYRSLAPDYLDGQLSDEQKAAVGAHLRECQFCPPLAQAVIGLREALERGCQPTDIHAQTSRFLRSLTQDERTVP